MATLQPDDILNHIVRDLESVLYILKNYEEQFLETRKLETLYELNKELFAFVFDSVEV